MVDRINKSKKEHLKNQVIKLLVKSSLKVTSSQIVISVLCCALCYLFTSAHLFFPSFPIKGYSSSEYFIYCLGMSVTPVIQTISLYIGNFLKGKSLTFSIISVFNGYLLMSVIPFDFDNYIFESIASLIITTLIIILAQKYRNKTIRNDINDPITAYIHYSTILMENEYKRQITLTNPNEIEESIKRIDNISRQVKEIISN